MLDLTVMQGRARGVTRRWGERRSFAPPPQNIFAKKMRKLRVAEGHLSREGVVMFSLTSDSPLGPITLREEDSAIVALDWGGCGVDSTPVLVEAHRQLAAYFAGELSEFDVPLAPKVSARQKEFLDALLAIPFGETMTYGEIAEVTGMSAQGAGQACGANPIAILIPCHRVTGTGNLGGFSAKGGVETKVALLRLEGAAGLLI